MPEFILDRGSQESAREFASLDCFTQGYIEAMFFTSTGTGDDSENGLEDASFADLAPSTLANIIADCAAFQRDHAALLDAAMRSPSYDETDSGYGLEAAGRDYWYSRNGHGTGFWDRGLGDIGEALHHAARYSELNLCRGDDGLIYLE